jgi:hypothetical protein
MWILVIISYLHGQAVSAVPFSSKAECEAAKVAIQKVVDRETTLLAGISVTMACEAM